MAEVFGFYLLQDRLLLASGDIVLIDKIYVRLPVFI